MNKVLSRRQFSVPLSGIKHLGKMEKCTVVKLKIFKLKKLFLNYKNKEVIKIFFYSHRNDRKESK